KYGTISKQMAEIGERRIVLAREMAQRIDRLMAEGKLEEALPRLKPEVDRINNFPVSEKLQLELPLGLVKLKPWRPLWDWVRRR
ncbi:MAG: hypothetical protein Q8O05_07120, partial [Chloroflexota bacterium]|nr:hypothetical protein [Chloroflexota bacterium]